jgi:hypothetical protein
VLPWSFESRPWFNGLPGTERRLLDIEHLQYQMISNPEAGVTPTIGDVHDSHVYDAQAARRWAAVEAELLDSYPVR